MAQLLARCADILYLVKQGARWTGGFFRLCMDHSPLEVVIDALKLQIHLSYIPSDISTINQKRLLADFSSPLEHPPISYTPYIAPFDQITDRKRIGI